MSIARSLRLLPLVLLLVRPMLACSRDADTPAPQQAPANPSANPPATEATASKKGPAAPGAEPEDAAPPVDRWCTKQSPHSFCADFDGPDFTEGWPNAFYALTSGGLSTTTSDRSAPTAVTIAQAEGNGAHLTHSLYAESPTSLHVAVDTRVEDFGGDTDSSLAVAFSTAKDEPVAIVLFDLSEQESSLQMVVFGKDGNGVPRSASAPALQRSRWTRVELSLEQGPDGWTSTVTFDGTPAATVRYRSTEPPTEALASAIVILGPEGEPPDGQAPFRVSYDNVTADVQ